MEFTFFIGKSLLKRMSLAVLQSKISETRSPRLHKIFVQNSGSSAHSIWTQTQKHTELAVPV